MNPSFNLFQPEGQPFNRRGETSSWTEEAESAGKDSVGYHPGAFPPELTGRLLEPGAQYSPWRLEQGRGGYAHNLPHCLPVIIRKREGLSLMTGHEHSPGGSFMPASSGWALAALPFRRLFLLWNKSLTPSCGAKI